MMIGGKIWFIFQHLEVNSLTKFHNFGKGTLKKRKQNNCIFVPKVYLYL